MKQTAVDWLYEKILLTPLDIREINKCLEQAKAMEKQQIVDAWFGGYLNGECKTGLKSEQYYTETYESNT